MGGQPPASWVSLLLGRNPDAQRLTDLLSGRTGLLLVLFVCRMRLTPNPQAGQGDVDERKQAIMKNNNNGSHPANVERSKGPARRRNKRGSHVTEARAKAQRAKLDAQAEARARQAARHAGIGCRGFGYVEAACAFKGADVAAGDASTANRGTDIARRAPRHGASGFRLERSTGLPFRSVAGSSVIQPERSNLRSPANAYAAPSRALCSLAP